MKEELIKILLDKNADESDRDDAASWLRDCTDNETLEALYKIASDKNDNYFVQVKVGSVMGEILTKRNTFEQDKHYLIGLTEASYDEAIEYIKSVYPDWIK